jgi:hypothetical protein
MASRLVFDRRPRAVLPVNDSLIMIRRNCTHIIRNIDQLLGAAPRGFPEATIQARTNEVQLDLAHGAFEPEQEPVIEDAWMAEAIGVGDERIDQGAQVEQVTPVPVVAGHA